MHNCHTLTIITTTRKCVSVVASAIAFKHPFTTMQNIGVVLVLGSTVAEVITGKIRKDKEAAAKAAAVADKDKND